jgi:hypothetical protein
LVHYAGILRVQRVIYHPVDGSAAPGLTKVITLCCVAHILFCKFAGIYERQEEVEIVGPTCLNHLHGGKGEVKMMVDVCGKRTDIELSIDERYIKIHTTSYSLE